MEKWCQSKWNGNNNKKTHRTRTKWLSQNDILIMVADWRNLSTSFSIMLWKPDYF
jgi:hypothetical protein